MPRWKPILVVALVVTAGLIAGLAFDRVYEIRMRSRPPDPLASTAVTPLDADLRAPLLVRLVDIGGVGIPLERWGTDYSHDRRAFRDARLLLLQAPLEGVVELERRGRGELRH
jgi:hypothetical protein